MTTIKRYFAAALGLSLGVTVWAQPMQPLAPGQIGLSLSSTATVSGKGSLKADNVSYKDVGLSSSAWTLTQRFGLGSGQHLALALDYDQTDIDHNGSAQIPLPERLQSLGASLRYFRPINQQWMLSASAGGASQVAGSDLLSDGWGARASGIGIYNHSRKLTLMAGVAYNSLSQDLKLLPVLGCDWRPNEQWSFAFGFPRTGASYKINKKVTLGLAVSGGGGAFQVKNDPMPGAASRSLADSRLQFLEVRLGFHCDWKINDTFRISGTLGQVLYRQFKYIDHDYKLKSDGTVPFASVAGTLSL